MDRLPTGQSPWQMRLARSTAGGSARPYYMINCPHPAHFAHVLEPAPWLKRLRRSPAGLDAAPLIRSPQACTSHCRKGQSGGAIRSGQEQPNRADARVDRKVSLDTAKVRFALLDKCPAGFLGVFRTLQDPPGI